MRVAKEIEEEITDISSVS